MAVQAVEVQVLSSAPEIIAWQGEVNICLTGCLQRILTLAVNCYNQSMDENKNQEPLGQASESQPAPQPTTEVNGQSYQPADLISSSHFDQTPVRKPSKWRYLFVVLGILQAFGIAIFFLIMALAIQQAKAGASGTEYIGLFLFITVVPAVGFIALINLIGLPVYIAKYKPRGKGLIFSILSLVISVILALYGAYSVYQLRVVAPEQEKVFTEELRKKSEQREQQFAEDNAKPEITKEEAINLLKSCQLKGFYYTNQTSRDLGGWGELSSTGIVLTKVDGKPYRISIADRLVPELVPIARDAQKTCGGPQFWHDGRYEQRQSDGTWR